MWLLILLIASAANACPRFAYQQNCTGGGLCRADVLREMLATWDLISVSLLDTWDVTAGNHPYAIGFGTLLGALREQDINSRTVDIIVPDHKAMLNDDFFRKRLYDAGLTLFEVFPSLSRVCVNENFPGVAPWILPKSRSSRYEQPYMDVYYVDGLNVGPCRFENDFFINGTAIIHGNHYPIPNNPKGFLTWVYGNDWMTAQHTFHLCEKHQAVF